MGLDISTELSHKETYDEDGFIIPQVFIFDF